MAGEQASERAILAHFGFWEAIRRYELSRGRTLDREPTGTGFRLRVYLFGYILEAAMEEPPKLKPLYWVASSKKDLLMDVFGYALYLAQIGRKHEQAKALKGFGSAGVLEIVEDWKRSTYRAVYTVRFERAVFVLHVFHRYTQG